MKKIHKELFQTLFMSFVLYLFFNADLLELPDRSKITMRMIDFVNNINMLTYKKCIKKSCVTLKHIHFTCVQWTDWPDIIFILKKYELIYLSCRMKRFNTWKTMKTGDVITKSKIDNKLLKFQINFKLK